jgi:hypothetical protein
MNLRLASALAVLLLVAPLETFAGAKGASAAKSAKGFTEAEAQKWVKWLETKPTPSKGPRNQFEILHTGPVNFRVTAGGKAVWADGVRVEKTGAVLLEAKYISKDKASPFAGKARDKEIQFIRDQVEDEFRRYAAIIGDRKTPATSLEVIVNSSGAAPYFNGLLKTFHIPGRVVIRSAQ